MSQADREAVIENERRFHNERFTEETREAQGKYYASIKHGSKLFEKRVFAASQGTDVLEYGCGGAIQGLRIGRAANTLTGIDISDVAVRDAQETADKAGLTNVKYHVMNAEDMTFEDNSFDLIFGRGIIHHLDLDLSFKSIARVLKPGGTALFWEPLGHNPVLNRYRDMTPDARTPDEHPLMKSDFDLAKKYLEVGDLEFFGLSTILSVPFRDTPFGNFVLKTTSVADQVMFKTPARWMAWHVLMEMKKPG